MNVVPLKVLLFLKICRIEIKKDDPQMTCNRLQIGKIKDYKMCCHNRSVQQKIDRSLRYWQSCFTDTAV